MKPIKLRRNPAYVPNLARPKGTRELGLAETGDRVVDADAELTRPWRDTTC